MTSDLADLSALALVEGFRSGAFTSVDATEAALARIEKFNEHVNAYCLVDREGALKAAAASAQRWKNGRALGSIDGVPCSVKELLNVEGWPTHRCSLAVNVEKVPATDDAPCVSNLRRAGAVFLGKTTSPEIGWKAVTDSPLFGLTRNPWNLSVTSGGSSGGAAAAAALGMGALHIGTDGGGSVRIPASFCGIVGHKPSYGRVPIYPPSTFRTLAHVGPMTRTVADAALMLDIMSGCDIRDWTVDGDLQTSCLEELEQPHEGLRIAYCPTLGYVEVDPEVADSVEQAVKVFDRIGAKVDEVDAVFDDPEEVFKIHWYAGAELAVSQLDQNLIHKIDPRLLKVVEQAKTYTSLDFQKAAHERALLGSGIRIFHQKYDLLITPTMPITAFDATRQAPEGSRSDEWVKWTPFTFPFNLTRQPAISVPCGMSSSGLPIGLQIVGDNLEDSKVLAAARAFERDRGVVPIDVTSLSSGWV